MSSSNEDIYNETFESVIQRVKKLLNIEKDVEIARALRTTSSSISTWRTRDTIPFAKLVSFAVRNGVSLDQLLTGRGEKELNVPNTPAPALLDDKLQELNVSKYAAGGAFGANGDTALLGSSCPDERPERVEEKAGGYSDRPALDIDLLATITDAVERAIDKEGRPLSTKKKADLIASLYDIYMDSVQPVDPDKVRRLISAAA